MSPTEKPSGNEGDVLSGLPRTRPQRRSARRAGAGVAPAAGTVATPAPAKAAPKVKATPATARGAAKPKVAAPTTAAKPKAKASPKPAAKPRKPPRQLDVPSPAPTPNAAFAPPASGKAPEGSPPIVKDGGTDVVGAVREAAEGVVQAGVGIAKTILGRLPRP